MCEGMYCGGVVATQPARKAIVVIRINTMCGPRHTSKDKIIVSLSLLLFPIYKESNEVFASDLLKKPNCKYSTMRILKSKMLSV